MENYLVGLKIQDLANVSQSTRDNSKKMENAQQHLKTELERKENVEAVYNREKLYAFNLSVGVAAIFFYIYKYKFTLFK